jgi:hypothetical protein
VVTGAGRRIAAGIAVVLVPGGAKVKKSRQEAAKRTGSKRCAAMWPVQPPFGEAARVMTKTARGGRVVNMSSANANCLGAGVGYDASKAAISQLTRALA